MSARKGRRKTVFGVFAKGRTHGFAPTTNWCIKAVGACWQTDIRFPDSRGRPVCLPIGGQKSEAGVPEL